MIIREVGVNDVIKLQEISINTFVETFAKDNTEQDMKTYLEQRLSQQKLSEEVANPNMKFYFAEIDGEIIGYLKLNFSDAQTELQDHSAVEIERIYVLNNFQNKGVGKELYQYAVNIAVKRKAKYIWLGVWEHNHKAIKFYQKNGFVVFDKHIFQLGSDAQTDWLMKKEL
ncbi:GNAT family acetyltransferase [Gallibacterium salpingitidis]|uniref:GNAT family acetyltransferase n=2 Tax=Gallibacterium salpingitidis TaxID=505341 RepID=A0A1A7NQG7_9PAST|nr:GNAT family acetyltransferase [Gallibacterium salpingitidis]